MNVRPQDLPSTFPIFPLPNVVLFPSAKLPLHIFEPRYRQMTADALEGNRVIGMVLMRQSAAPAEPTNPSGGAEPGPPPPPPSVYEVGCAGRIGQYRQLPDGRYNFILEGVSRFRILEEIQDEKLYRSVRAEVLPEPSFGELDPPSREALDALRTELEAHLMELAKRSAPDAERELKARIAELNPIQLVHAVAFGLDCNVIEKQGLLDADGPVLRSELLSRLLEFRKAETQHSTSSKWIN